MSWFYSTIARTSPAFTAVPSLTRIFWTVPCFGDLISFCIFIASTTTTPAPASTADPSRVSTRTIFPAMGAVNFLGPWSSAARVASAMAAPHRASAATIHRWCARRQRIMRTWVWSSTPRTTRRYSRNCAPMARRSRPRRDSRSRRRASGRDMNHSSSLSATTTVVV